MRLLTITATCLLTALTPSKSFGLDLDRLTEAVGQVETGMRHDAVGDYMSARGAWQMHQGAWKEASARVDKSIARESWFFGAVNPAVSRAYAKAYLSILADKLRTLYRRDPTPAEVYAAYRRGYGEFSRQGGDLSSLSRSVLDSCRRVENIYRK